MIPITSVRVSDRQRDLVLEVLESGQLAAGSYVERFEQLFAEIHDVRHAIAVNNGTTALIAAVKAVGLRPGDEVVTSPFTFVATLNAILDAGATARFADIGDDFNLDAAAARDALTDRTRAVMPVHLYGLPAQMDEFEAIAGDHDLALIEDAAQAVGATFEGRPAGSFGIGCFSLYATKNISTGEGGVVTTNDDDVADTLRLMRNQGMRQRYQYEMAGNNYRLTNVAAALGIPQLEQLDELTARRQHHAAVLREGLAGIAGLALPPESPTDRTHVYHQFTVRIGPDAPVSRDEFVARLGDAGIGAGIYYPRLVFDYDCYRDHPGVIPADVPLAAAAASEVVSLPVHQHLTEIDLAGIVDGVRAVMSR